MKVRRRDPSFDSDLGLDANQTIVDTHLKTVSWHFPRHSAAKSGGAGGSPAGRGSEGLVLSRRTFMSATRAVTTLSITPINVREVDERSLTNGQTKDLS